MLQIRLAAGPGAVDPRAGRRPDRRSRWAVKGAVGALVAAGALSVLAGPVAAQSPSAGGPVVTEFALENGMRGVVIEDHRAPVVTHMVWYNFGAADEPPRQSGIAHFVEHLMFKGTEEIPPGEFSRIIAANGGQDNAFTSLDYTGYFQRIAADRLDMVMRMEADRMVNLTLDEESVRTERDVVLEERNDRTDKDPEGLFAEQMDAALFQNHPYGVPVIGWRAEIEQLSRQNAVDYYEAYYTPQNAILVVAGDVDPAEVEALAREIYGPIPASGRPPEPRPLEPPQRAARRLVMEDARVQQPYVMRFYISPSYVTAEPGQAEALALLARILGGGLDSRLARDLMVEQRLAIDSGAFYRGTTRDESIFVFYVVPADGVSLDDAEAAADAVLARLVAEGPTEAELARAKSAMIAARIYQQDSQSSMARLYGLSLTIGLSVEDVREWPARIEAVTPEDVRAAAALLVIERSVTGHLTRPAAEAAE